MSIENNPDSSARVQEVIGSGRAESIEAKHEATDVQSSNLAGLKDAVDASNKDSFVTRAKRFLFRKKKRQESPSSASANPDKKQNVNLKEAADYIAESGGKVDFKEDGEKKKISISLDSRKLPKGQGGDEKIGVLDIVPPMSEFSVSIKKPKEDGTPGEEVFSQKVHGKVGQSGRMEYSYKDKDGKEIMLESDLPHDGFVSIETSLEFDENWTKEEAQRAMKLNAEKAAVRSQTHQQQRMAASPLAAEMMVDSAKTSESGSEKAPERKGSGYLPLESLGSSSDPFRNLIISRFGQGALSSDKLPPSQKVESSETKKTVISSLKDEIDKLKAKGWDGRVPLIIVKASTLYNIVPGKDGVSIDLNNPDTFLLFRGPCATGRGGFGTVSGSNATPEGAFRLDNILGPRGIFKFGSVPLNGIDTQNKNSATRGIWIHPSFYNTPGSVSRGCVNVPLGQYAFITDQLRTYGTCYAYIDKEKPQDNLSGGALA